MQNKKSLYHKKVVTFLILDAYTKKKFLKNFFKKCNTFNTITYIIIKNGEENVQKYIS